MIALPPPEQIPAVSNRFVEVWYRFFRQVTDALTGKTPPQVPVVTVSRLPTVTPAGQIVLVSDETGGPTLAYSYNYQWLRVSDGAVVS